MKEKVGGECRKVISFSLKDLGPLRYVASPFSQTKKDPEERFSERNLQISVTYFEMSNFAI